MGEVSGAYGLVRKSLSDSGGGNRLTSMVGHVILEAHVV